MHLQPKVATLRVEKSARSRTNTLIINSPPLTYLKIRYIIHYVFWDLDSNMVLVRTSLLSAALLGLAGCVGGTQTSGQSDGIFDPFESTNRRIHEFNRTIDKVILSPASEVYGIVPEELRLLLDNAATNLTEPTNFVNHVLQADPESAGVVLLRFAINSTLGVLGIFDVAGNADFYQGSAPQGLRRQEEDFGQTLATWGVPAGPYIILPLLGPSTLRDAFSLGVDSATNPMFHIEKQGAKDKLLALRIIDLRDSLLPLDDTMQRAQDPYVFLRSAFRQNREFQIWDGNPPMDQDLYDEEFD